jgi:hypothetical protein
MLSTLSNNEQVINYNDLIVLDSNNCSINEIKVLSTGMYVINISCQFDDSCIIGLFVDDKEESIHQTESHINNSSYENQKFTKSNYLLIHQILKLNTNNTLTLKYLSTGPNKIINLENKFKIWKL